MEKLNDSIESFHENFKVIKTEKIMMLKLIFVTIIQLTVFFAITYCVYRMFGLNETTFIKIISAQAFLSMIMAFIPIPGAGGAAEGGFYILFSTFFSKETINMAVLFWRMYTFYLPILVGGLFMIKLNKKEKLLDEVDNEK